MRVQSIWAPVQRRDVAGDGLLLATTQVPLGEVNRVGKGHDLAQKIRPGTEALQDAGNQLPTAESAPLLVHFGGFAGSFIVLDDADIRHG